MFIWCYFEDFEVKIIFVLEGIVKRLLSLWKN